MVDFAGTQLPVQFSSIVQEHQAVRRGMGWFDVSHMGRFRLSGPESRLRVVQVWDHGSGPAVEKAIRDAGLGLNPSREGATIRVPVPELNEERRKELIKVAGKYAESARIAIRNIRRDAMDDVKKREKDGHISEDDVAKQNKDIQTTTDKYIKQVDDMLHQKEQDIKTV